jgi:TonB family protein
VTIDVDFPYAWYIQAVHRKVSQNWDGQAREGTQPVIMFEIERNGQVGRVSVEKTSGNAVYDQVAVRAIQNSTPFPELPADFKAPLIRVHLSFGFAPRQG